ncbi:MAG: bifunctional DNA-binding transcriptional regulator/O6-methylguanine-DNA methyltransferase Ada [Methylovirgula sp.]|uniref:bifunctional DNA-binding transcriptional regulator/O6-methylguanine-DNA methyltransferase Ada n=1 Tax=Methylovirgula sp. TaxID=1978224 RepID=UPI0030766261
MRDEQRWAAVSARDRAFDGDFVFAVKTTGIYCRPSCPARHAQRRNVIFFLTGEAAEREGFRACLRCRPKEAPNQRQRAAVATACRALETDEPPTLEVLAARAGLSAFHFHRVFKTMTGVTPKAYAKAHRAAKVRQELSEATSVTEAIYAAGYNTSSRFYENADTMIGMTPNKFRQQGNDAEIVYGMGKCSLGTILVARSDKGICALMLGDDAAELENEIKLRFAKAKSIKDDESFSALLTHVIVLADEPSKKFDLPLDIRGTLFQQKVWAALRAIPAGETASYTEVARRIGSPRATRAVAQACAANKIAIAIPCHRVVRSDGALSGYRWGPARKRALLDKERKK